MRKHRIEPISSFGLIFLLIAQTALGAGETGFPNGITASKGRFGLAGTPDSKAALEVNSTTKAFLPPRMTTTQRDAISSPTEGSVIYNTTTKELNRYNGTAWAAVGGGAGGIYAGGSNLLTNNSWENDSTGWTSTGTGTGCSGSSAYARTTTAGQYSPPGVGGACFDSASAAETLTAASTTITNGDGISGRNGAGSCILKAATGTATHLLEVYDGTNVIASTTVTSSTSQFVRSTVPNFSFPQSGTVTLRLKSVASNEPVVYLDDCFLGLSENFNQSQSSKATLYASVLYTNNASCDWAVTSGWPSVFANDADCTAVSVVGNATLPTAGSYKPQIVLPSMPPGRYRVVANGHFYAVGSGSNGLTCNFRFYDGTNRRGGAYADYHRSDSVQAHGNSIEGFYEYTSTASRTIDIETDRDADSGITSPACHIAADASTRYLSIQVYRFPTSSDVGQRLDNYNWRVDANISGSNFNLGTSDQATYVSMTNGSETLTNNTSTTGNVLTAQIPCSGTNPPTGTTCAAGTEDNGVSFVLPAAGDVRACVSFSHYIDLGASGAVDAAFEIVETPNNAQTISQEGKERINSGFNTASHALTHPLKVCGTFSFTSAGQKTLRLFYEQDDTATVNNDLVIADAASTIGQRDIHWEVWPLTVMTPTPVFYGGAMGTITNDSASAGYIGEYKESVVSATNCPTTAQYGDLTSLSLTPGDWDVTGNVQFIRNTASEAAFTYVEAGISTTSGNSGTGLVGGSNEFWYRATSGSAGINAMPMYVPAYRVSLSATTTYYLKFFCTYSANQPQASGRLSARRVR